MIREVVPRPIIMMVMKRGILGRFRTIKRRCGWKNTNITQKMAKYIIYGVKIASRSAAAKAKQKIGLGRFSP